MTHPYGTEMFGISVFLVLCNRVVAVLFALGMMAVEKEQMKNAAPMWKYCAISLANVGATWCQYEALKYVSFPMQMLGKSFKMVPVMIWAMIISQKRYDLNDWCIAACVSVGVTQFIMSGSIAAEQQSGNTSYGLMLLLMFLALDGFTSNFQEKLFKVHNTSKYNQIFYVNACSSLVALLSLIASHQFVAALSFTGRHVELAKDAFNLSLAAVAGQWFIYSEIKELGALVFAATMNLRQVVSILLSYAAFGHPLSSRQGLSLVVIFSALFYKTHVERIKAKEKEGKETALLVRKDRQPLGEGGVTANASPLGA